MNSCVGSPPQVRGKPLFLALLVLSRRITPAGAGKTKTRAGFYRPRRDHPRRCGENSVSIPLIFDSAGSPPQVRGKQLKQHCAECCARITPAGAGKTLRAHVNAVVTADHPRRCGENADLLVAKRGALGSPPQVRGKRKFVLPPKSIPRITPAGAGKTPPCLSGLQCQADHPRRCGENNPINVRHLFDKGSPPQVRGKRGLSLGVESYLRITPAGAGKTWSGFGD